ncbi:hypothetical protein ABZY36_38090 [Streptomyces sp. NPDC006627]|uniref:hypothetical protein n=1 Tax=Streptomyces sp. NPDC006627 TaxID=3154679 RepID=UPI0033BDEA2D
MSQQPTPPSDRAARLPNQAARLRAALSEREQRTDSGGPEHDHGLHIFLDKLLVTASKHIVLGKVPAAPGVAELVLEAEPLREALAFREDGNTRRRETDWELHSLAYQLLTSVDWLSAAYPEMDTLSPETIAERQRARPFSEWVAQTVAAWPAGQRARLAEEVAHQGGQLPAEVTEALQAEAGRGE